ncbi:TerC family protein [Macrococcus armenti]|uniref:TerC family protein n=1 Tax=Macrococcus armenti TaxID=2875764 RepID=UPI001CCCBA6D|nr:TerC family protein [Macrococcus armenti]UBH22496.1 TerC family protein [Macrococcus armenti]
MDPSILLAYAWVIVVLVLLEGLLAADNAIVMAVMVKHLPEEQRKKALFYGLVGAFVFRLIALFFITVLAKYWWIQAAGAAYLLFMSAKSLYTYFKNKNHADDPSVPNIAEEEGNETKGSGFWMTVLKVEFADIAFAIDSMLAAIAIAVTLPHVGPDFMGLNAGQFAVMFTGGMLGVVLMRFAATYFIKLLEKYPGLEAAAFAIVGWIGVKLVVLVLAHDSIHVLPHEFPHSPVWQLIFWTVLLSILAIGFITSARQNKRSHS